MTSWRERDTLPIMEKLEYDAELLNMTLREMENLTRALDEDVMGRPFTDQEFHNSIAKLKSVASDLLEQAERAKSLIGDWSDVMNQQEALQRDLATYVELKRGYSQVAKSMSGELLQRDGEGAEDFKLRLAFMESSGMAANIRDFVPSLMTQEEFPTPLAANLKTFQDVTAVLAVQTVRMLFFLLQWVIILERGVRDVFGEEILSEGLRETAKEAAASILEDHHMAFMMPGVTLFKVFLNKLRNPDDLVEKQEVEEWRYKLRVSLALYYDWLVKRDGMTSILLIMKNFDKTCDQLRVEAGRARHFLANETKDHGEILESRKRGVLAVLTMR